MSRSGLQTFPGAILESFPRLSRHGARSLDRRAGHGGQPEYISLSPYAQTIRRLLAIAILIVALRLVWAAAV